MENLYPSSEYKCTDHVDWKNHFNTFNKLVGLSRIPLIKSSSDKVRLTLFAESVGSNLDYKDMKKLELVCGLHPLNVPGEAPQQPAHSKLPRKDILKRAYLESNKHTNTELKTVNVKVKWMNITDLGKRRKFVTKSLVPKKSSGYLDLYPGKDILITVKIYHPFLYIYSKDNRNYSDKVRCSHELVILGSQTLTDLKDKILCENSKGVYPEITDLNDIKSLRQRSSQEDYPSSFIFVDDTFYCDLRHANASDMSEGIREWAKMKKIGEFHSGDMSETKLSELKFRIGYPYVFQHVADCEHVIIFSDVRLLTKADQLMSKDYPFLSNVHRANKASCGICDSTIATCLVLDSDRLPNSKMFFCDQCFKSYNFIDGQKVGNFRAYPYYDRSTVL